ncbi:MAG: UDP-glucuronosyltransferase [Deltaproteobacteria bacterium]|nr:UDP-glucuronosyltransferase [Deltaproteobacteria bacterium]
MKILYGVVGEGMGHSTRSSVLIRHLLENQHEVIIVASDRAYHYLKNNFPGCQILEIEGYKFIYEHGAVDRSRSLTELIKRLPEMLAKNVKQFIKLCGDFNPAVVISDFDSFAYTFGVLNDLPIISIDNIQMLNRSEIEIDIPQKYQGDFKLAKAIVKSKLPGAQHYMITSFFYPKLRKERTTLYPPILRPEILNQETSTGNHVVVYQTSTSDHELIETLKTSDCEFRVYGFRRNENHGNVILKDFSEKGFVEDLASARAVIANGGFSLMSEAVFFGKPYLAMPVKKQFEQVFNSLYLEKMGYGMFCEELTAETVRTFLSRTDEYARHLESYKQDGNELIKRGLDALLGEIENKK